MGAFEKQKKPALSNKNAKKDLSGVKSTVIGSVLFGPTKQK